MFCYIRKKFFIDHLQTYFDFFNEMPRNLMISGHLRFSFFSRCGTFVQRRSKENEIQAHSRQSHSLSKTTFSTSCRPDFYVRADFVSRRSGSHKALYEVYKRGLLRRVVRVFRLLVNPEIRVVFFDVKSLPNFSISLRFARVILSAVLFII